jgi:hypothetical protein
VTNLARETPVTIRVLITHDQERYNRAIQVTTVDKNASAGAPSPAATTIFPGDTKTFFVWEGCQLRVDEVAIQ